jgi:hypothetical protein
VKKAAKAQKPKPKAQKRPVKKTAKAPKPKPDPEVAALLKAEPQPELEELLALDAAAEAEEAERAEKIRVLEAGLAAEMEKLQGLIQSLTPNSNTVANLTPEMILQKALEITPPDATSSASQKIPQPPPQSRQSRNKPLYTPHHSWYFERPHNRSEADLRGYLYPKTFSLTPKLIARMQQFITENHLSASSIVEYCLQTFLASGNDADLRARLAAAGYADGRNTRKNG